MKIVLASRRRLRDRNIPWKEKYGKKSGELKKKLDKLLPGSYFRWEGKDAESGHPYYVVVGPAISEREGKAFFAGVKKMPVDPRKKAGAPSGKYFSSLGQALAHASEMWGVSTPKNAGKYTKNDLLGIDIPRHMKG